MLKLKNIRRSLITRLMMYFLIAGFALIIIFGINIALGLKGHFKNEILPNIAQYLVYIKNDIGTPPNVQKAKDLSHKLSIKIQIVGPDLNWKSNNAMQDMSVIAFEPAPYPYQEFKIAHRHEHNFILIKEADYRYYLSLKRLKGSPSHARNIGLITVLIVFMLILFYLIRKSLQPLKTISSGINEIANGHLNSPIQINNSFEFEQLANGINNMSQEIQHMLEAKQQLLLAISHELRSPITRAQVNLALLPEDDIQKALKYDLLEMESLISQILESQRLNQNFAALNKTELKFNALIQSVIETYYSTNELELELTTCSIHADETRLMLLIKNLIDNALKYSKSSQQKPLIQLYSEDNFIILKIKDYGIGIAQEELDKITQAFYRIDKARQRTTGGFGLGLYLSHLIVKAHQGTMHFKSELGIGTTVTIKFPI